MGAHIIRTEAEAIEIARKLAASFAEGAGERDRDRRPPHAEVEELSASGLLGVTVPAHHGGVEVSVATLAEIVRTLATADASLAQIPHSHFVFLDALRRQGTRAQQAFYFGEALAGARFANAQSERGGRTITEDATTLRPHLSGGYVLDGVKYYSTGALFAHWLVVRAVTEEPESKVLAYIRRDTTGVEVEDDWEGMGQRTTASGTVRLTGVWVEADQVVSYSSLFAGPTTYGARAQILHAAIDTGIARGALDAAVAAVARARPWFESGAQTAAEDPLVVQAAGELEITVRAAEALLREGAEAIDAAERAPSSGTINAAGRDLSAGSINSAGRHPSAGGIDAAGRYPSSGTINSAGRHPSAGGIDAAGRHRSEAIARASVATAVAKVAAARASLDAASGLFELGGTRSAAASLNLSRYWRDARTHTLHDPGRWKIQHVGRWLVSGTPPPRHGLL